MTPCTRRSGCALIHVIFDDKQGIGQRLVSFALRIWGRARVGGQTHFQTRTLTTWQHLLLQTLNFPKLGYQSIIFCLNEEVLIDTRSFAEASAATSKATRFLPTPRVSFERKPWYSSCNGTEWRWLNVRGLAHRNDFRHFSKSSIQQRDVAKEKETKWIAQYEELVDHTKQTGHTTAAQITKDNPSLKKWLLRQQKQFLQWKQGLKSTMTQERQQKLDSQLDSSWRFTDVWMDRYMELETYHEVHGDCLVPAMFPENQALSDWVKHQRRLFKRYKRGIRPVMSEQRVNMLDRLSFELDVREGRWMKRYQELVQYKELHGNTLVNVNSGKLGNWVKQQRHEYRIFQRLEKGDITEDDRLTPLTDRRIELLNKIDFAWDPVEAVWLNRYRELLEYKESHGHCVVPKNSVQHAGLGIWVHQQRLLYHPTRRPAYAHTTHRVTDERRKLLEDVGFEWNPDEGAWMKRYNELVKYVEQNGNTMVPYQYPPNWELGYWVNKQRKLYRMKPNMTPRTPSQDDDDDDDREEQVSESPLPEHRRILLEKIGFIWHVGEHAWAKHYKELENYAKQHGHCHVPGKSTEHPGLSVWVHLQRKRYREMQRARNKNDQSGEKTLSSFDTDTNVKPRRVSIMTDKEFELLERLNFPWNVRRNLHKQEED